MDVQSVRAKVQIGDTILETPYVKAFSITRQRGVLWANASVTLELPTSSDNQASGDTIKIYATVDDDIRLLFTGYVNTLDITPSMSKYGGVMLNITAYDKLYKLRLLKVSRRIQVSPGDIWCSITGITRKKGESTSSRFEPKRWAVKTVIDSSSTGDPNYDPLTDEAKKKLSTAEKAANNIQTGSDEDAPPGGLYPDNTLPAHSHSTWEHGGPAIGVFGDYSLYTEEEE
jgi:hypothetical protein